MLSPRRRGAAWAALPLLVLAVVLEAALAFNLAHLDTGGPAVPKIPSSGGSDLNLSGLMALLPLSMIAAGVTALVMLLGDADVRPRWDGEGGFLRRGLRRRLLLLSASVLALAVVLRLTTPIFDVLAGSPSGAGPGLGREPGTIPIEDDPGGGDGGDSGATPIPDPSGLLGALFVVARYLFGIRLGVENLVETSETPWAALFVIAVPALALALAIARLARPDGEVGGPSRGGSRETPRRDDGPDGYLQRIAPDPDIRAAVQRCFREFCVLIGRRGVLDQEVLTPRELEDLAIDRLRVSRDAAEAVTTLFEEARYSTHALDESHRLRAVAGLEEIRAAFAV